MDEFLAAFQAEYGEITDDDIDAASRASPRTSDRHSAEAPSDEGTARRLSVVLDAGALVAIERGDRDLGALLMREARAARTPRTHGGVVGQVWRGGRDRQALLAQALRAIEVVALDDDLGRRAGLALARSRTADVIDAAVVLLARDGDEIYTSDADDLAVIADALGADVELISV